MPSFLSIDASKTTLTLATINVSDTGDHNVSFTVTLQNYNSVIGLTKNFSATITCIVNSVAFTNYPSTIVIEPGVTV
jgi:hypothetical protein